MLSQHSRVHQRISGIPCKSTDGFRQNSVNSPFAAVVYKTVKIIPFSGFQSGDSLIRINIDQLHRLVFPDQPVIVLNLRRKRVKLVAGIAGNTAVSRNTYAFLRHGAR